MGTASGLALSREVVRLLGKYGGPGSIPALVELLGDTDPALRRASAEALDRMGRTHWLMRVKGDDKDWDRLAASSDERSLGPLIGGARRGELRAIALLAEGGVTSASGTLRGLLTRSRPEVQRAASLALATLTGDAGIRTLQRAGATAVLVSLCGEIGVGSEALEALMALRAPQREQAARAVLYGAHREQVCAVTDELEGLFFSPLRRRELGGILKALREPRLVALEFLHDLRAREAMHEALVDRDPKLRGRASRLLALMGETRWEAIISGSAGDLRRLAESSEPERIALVVAARKLGAELPNAARELLEEHQGGAFSLGNNEVAGAVSLSEDTVPGALSLPPETGS